MCGLAGFIDRSGAMTADALRATAIRMNDAIRHRGPDASGAWVDAEAGVALGHRRLSIVDLSVEGRQPMHSASGRYVILFNGEIYNFQKLRMELGALGSVFRGHSDTEVMLAAFEQWGIRSSVERFNGMFAFALWDRETRVLHLCRDRIGKKPMYYGWLGHTFVFGSELKALREHPDFNASIDRDVLAVYFRHGYIPSPYCIYEGLRKLPPGCLLSIRDSDNGVNRPVERYWSALESARAAMEHPMTDLPEALSQLETLLRDATDIRMIADVPLGAFLSGGIDSSLVVALMQSLTTQPVKTFSIGFKEASHDEAGHARVVARHLGTDHTELYVTPDEARSVIPHLPAMFDEPFADCSQIPTFLVSKLARQSVTVALSGDGGDELFSGYTTYTNCARQFARRSKWPSPLRRAIGMGVTGVPSGVWDTTLGLLGFEHAGARLHRMGSVFSQDSIGAAYRQMLAHWTFPDRVVRHTRELCTPFSERDYAAASNNEIEVMMLLDAAVYLPDDILVKVDRASMAVSLEARCPILDYRVFEFAWRLPLRWKRRNREGKSILKDLVYRLVPRELLDRPKSGFDFPMAEWLRGPLREWASDLLSSDRIRREGWLDAKEISATLRLHQEGFDSSNLLWTALMFQSWLDLYPSNTCSAPCESTLQQARQKFEVDRCP
jgi:asparagine synthase (glutamine-hydrolysing)